MALLNNKNSIIDIFNDMSFDDAIVESSMDSNKSDLDQADIILEEVNRFIEEARDAQIKWKILPTSAKAAVLKKMWKVLSKTSDFGADYFTYYSDLLSENIVQSRAVGIILLVMSNRSPFFVFCSVLSAALAAGNAVIVCTTDKKLRNLESSFFEAGLPKRLCTFAPANLEIDAFMLHKIDCTVVFDVFSKVQELYKKCVSTFRFLCPNNTAALLLESCDIIAAIEKILSHTWGSNSDKMCAVSTIIVQESIYEKFVNHLEFQLDNLNCDKNNCELKDTFKVKQLESAIKHAQISKKFGKNKDAWSPTIILQCEDQDWEPNPGYIKVKICRTAREGVALLNNSHHFLGLSVWTEISSLALEVASMLKCKCIWINSHGVISPSIPFTPSGSCGSLICGGTSGIIQFMSNCHDDNDNNHDGLADNNISESIDLKNFLKLQPSCESKWVSKKELASVSQSANKAHNLWWLEKNRKSYLQKVANFFSRNESYLADLHMKIRDCINLQSSDIDLSEHSLPLNHLTIQRKCPFGVIVLFLHNCTSVYYSTIVFLISLALVLGSAIIIVMEKDVPKTLIVIIKIFKKFLPKDLIQVIVHKNGVLSFASDANVQNIWIYDESFMLSELYQNLKACLASALNIHCLIIPKKINTLSFKLCLHSKIIWLPKVDQFP